MRWPIFISMSTTHKSPKALMSKTQVIRHIITFFKSLANGDSDTIAGDTTDEIMASVATMSECSNCNGLQNNFWCHMVPMDTQVIVCSKFVGPVSLLAFFVVRKAKLSLHRLKNAEFNDDEWTRIRDAIEALRDVELVIYDLRHDDAEVIELDNGTNIIHFIGVME